MAALYAGNPYQYPVGVGAASAWQYQQPMAAQAQQQTNVVKVSGRGGADAYPMGPNSAMVLMDAGEDVFYWKTTDGGGFPTVRAFRFEEIGTQQPQAAQAVTREEFDELRKQVAELSSAKG